MPSQQSLTLRRLAHRYNSVLFSTLSANDYMAVVVTPDFLDGAAWNRTFFNTYSPQPDGSEIATLQQNQSGLTKLSNKECLSVYYNQDFQSNWRNVLVVSNVEASALPGQSNTSIIDVYIHRPDSVFDDLGWPCGGTFGISSGNPYTGCRAAPDPDHWSMSIGFCSIFNFDFSCNTFTNVQAPVQYCLAQPTTPACSVKFSPSILIVVIVCNAIKVVCLACLVLMRRFSPLLNVGDAIVSFMHSPDSSTESAGPLSAVDVRARQSSSAKLANYSAVPAASRPWKGRRHRWWRAASKRRWLVAGFL